MADVTDNDPGTGSPQPDENDEEVDTSVEPNPLVDGASAETVQGGQTSSNGTTTAPDMTQGALEPEPKIPQKKDATLREFLGKIDDYAPIIPDAVTNHYLTLAGLPPPPQTPPHLARLLALATQKFISDIAADAYQYARIRSSHTTSNTATAMMGANLGLPGQAGAGVAPGPGGVGKDAAAQGKGNVGLGTQRPGFGGGGQGGGQGRTVLTMEDLGMAVGEYGINIKRGEFYR